MKTSRRRDAASVDGLQFRRLGDAAHAAAATADDPRGRRAAAATIVARTLGDVRSATQVVGSNAFEVARAHTDDVCIVEESDVALAVLRLLENEKLVVEGGGATGLAAILPGGPMHAAVQGKRVAVPLCGGNIDITTLGRIIDRGLAADCRLVRFVAEVSDRAGGIAQLTDILRDNGASVKDIFHERAWLQSAVDRVQIKVIVECSGTEHSLAVRQAMLDADVSLLVWGKTVYDSNGLTTELMSATGGPAQPAPFE